MNKEEIVQCLIIKYLQGENQNSDISEVSKTLLKSWGLTNDIVDKMNLSLIDLIPDSLSDEERLELLIQEGNVLLGLGHYDQSIEKFSEAISINSSISDLYSKRAAANMKKLNYAEAVEDLKKVISLDPQCSIAYTRLVFCYWSLCNNEQAKNTLEECKEKSIQNAELKNLEHLVQKYGFDIDDSSISIFQSSCDIEEATV